jgi:hypothetical protein
MRWEGHVEIMGQMGDEYRILVRNHKVEWKVLNWTDVRQERDKWWALVNMTMNLRVP